MPPKRRLKPDDHAHRMSLNQYLTKKGPGEEDHAPTPERVARALEVWAGEGGELPSVGLVVKANVLYTEKGIPTANFYWEICPILDGLRKRGVITQEECDAAQQFQSHYYHGCYRGPATSQFQPRYDNGSSLGMNETERRCHHQKLVHQTYHSVDEAFHRVLDWLTDILADSSPLSNLGRRYSTTRGRQTQSSQGAIMLKLTCEKLVKVYGIG